MAASLVTLALAFSPEPLSLVSRGQSRVSVLQAQTGDEQSLGDKLSTGLRLYQVGSK